MKGNKFIFSLIAASVAVSSCDMSSLEADMDSLEDRVEALESQFAVMKENLNSVSRLLADGTVINSVQGPDAGGNWTLSMSDGNTLTITQGSEGKIEYPAVAVDAEGYWTINGERLMNGNEPVRAIGQDGAPGKTPEFRINDGYWETRYIGEGDEAWTQVKDPEGNPVSVNGGSGEGGDSFFSDVRMSEDGKYFIFSLSGGTGTEYRIPVIPELACIIAEPESDYADGFWSVAYGGQASTDVTVSGDNVMVYAPTGWKAAVNDGRLTVAAPAMSSPQTRASADNSTDVVVQVYKDGYWAMDKIAVRTKIGSYYDLFMQQGQIEVCGETMTSEMFNEAVKVTSADQTVEDGKIYFVAEGVEWSIDNPTVTGSAIVGDNPESRSTVTLKGAFNIKNETGSTLTLALKNLDVAPSDLGETRPVLANNNNELAGGKVLLDNCRFKVRTTQSLAYFNGKNVTLDKVGISGCFVDLSGLHENETNIFNAYNARVTLALDIDNSVFYGNSRQTIRLVKEDANNPNTLSGLAMTGSSFINLKMHYTGFVKQNVAVTAFSAKDNLFYNSMVAATDKFAILYGQTGVTVDHAAMGNNHYYGFVWDWGINDLKNKNYEIQETEDPFGSGHAFDTEDLSTFCLEGKDYGANIK